MTPKEFESEICQYYREQGYTAEVTSYSGDYGVDVFAKKKLEKLAIQVKMYGNSTRKVNRQTVMELYGAAAYFDCSKAIIATDGKFLPDAVEVAHKLGVEILYWPPRTSTAQRHSSAPSPSKEKMMIPATNQMNTPSSPKTDTASSTKTSALNFDKIWERYIMPLQGQTLTGSRGSNQIVRVDWSGILRITSNGKSQTIKIEIFRLAVERLLKTGYISRDEINQNYPGRASSGIVLILSQVPFFEKTEHPSGLRMHLC